MEKDSLNNNTSIYTNNGSSRGERSEIGLLRGSSDPIRQTASSPDFVLQWGNRKRLRCMKSNPPAGTTAAAKDEQTRPTQRTIVRVDRLRADKTALNQGNSSVTVAINNNNINQNNGYFNLRQKAMSVQAQENQRVLRNSENSNTMRGQTNGAGGSGRGGYGTSDKGAHDKKGVAHDNNHKQSGGSSETAHDSRKGGGSSSGSGEAAPPLVWPPKFVIALTNKEKEEDFMVLKGSKLPQRPKKRAKFIQRTLSLVSPGGWLCDLTLERYEVREKKISKKKPRGLKAMGTMESESE